MKNVTINTEQKLYVIREGNGHTCLGFDVVADRSVKLANEMKVKMNLVEWGSMEAYDEYQRLIEIARMKHAKTGWRSQSELIPEFIGKEGQRVEVVTLWGETFRYYIGKSTGFIPVHLEIKKANSTGGGAVCGHPFKSIKFLNKHR
jgi:hypothetical protein